MANIKSKESYLHRLREQLITKEDPQHVHKTLGILVLISFLYRFANLPSMAFDSHPELTLPTVFLHLMLSTSALIFKIPPKRIKDGSRIWPEYRWHSIIFACRSVSIITLYWYEQTYHLKPMYWMNTVVQLVANGLADVVSWSAGVNHSDSVRDVHLPGYYKFFFSAIQLRASCAIVYGVRRFGWPFYMLFVIQIAAFLGTMNRKNLTNKMYTAWFYAAQLCGGIYISLIDLSNPSIHFLIHGAMANTVTILRMGPRLPKPFHFIHSKFTLWALAGIAFSYLRPNEDGTLPEGGLTEAQIKTFATASMLGMVALAVWKIPKYTPFETYIKKMDKLS